ncbi:radical SAM protein, partial [Treponema sp.]|uniref:radical SAM protein n=1 Tax=Treponema sp. TaxID=166 RepID=UPI00388F5117
FNPTEIIFACTTACNLHCPHCFINRNPSHLNTEDAVKFLKSVHDSDLSQIESIGFSGGEPFLCVDFLCKIIKEAVDNDFMFDRIMTNGDWWKTEEDLTAAFQKIYDAGYDGKIGLSYDTFHAQSEERIAIFIKTAWKFFGCQSIEIQSVKGEVSPCASTSLAATPSAGTSRNALNISEKLKSLADKLNLSYSEEISKSGRGVAAMTDSEYFLPAYIQTESYQSTDERAWKDKKWFKDDLCESMGQILFIHATGDIAPCCGFANENKELFIGKITDSFDTVLKNAAENKMTALCFETGLSNEIKKLQKEGRLPEGKTSDICTFCDYVCKLKA